MIWRIYTFGKKNKTAYQNLGIASRCGAKNLEWLEETYSPDSPTLAQKLNTLNRQLSQCKAELAGEAADKYGHRNYAPSLLAEQKCIENIYSTVAEIYFNEQKTHLLELFAEQKKLMLQYHTILNEPQAARRLNYANYFLYMMTDELLNQAHDKTGYAE